MATTTYGSPYAQSADLVSSWPATSLSVADRIDDVSFKGNGLNNQTASYTGVLTDAGKTIMMNVATANTFTIPASGSIAYELGTVLRVSNKGAGTTTVQPNGGVLLNGGNISLTQYQSCEVQLVAADIWVATVKPAPAVVSSGLTLVSSSAFSAVSSVSVNTCFTATYSNYRIVFYATGSTTADISWRLRASGSDLSGANYGYGQTSQTTGNASASYGTSGQTSLQLGSTQSGLYLASTMDVILPTAASGCQINYQAMGYNGSTYVPRSGLGLYSAGNAADGFTFTLSTGNMTGVVRTYGYLNS